MIKKIVKGTINEAKKFVWFDEHVRTLKWMKGMGKAVFIPKPGDPRALLHEPANRQAYVQKAKEVGANMERQHKIWKVLMLKSYIGFFAFICGGCFVATNFSVFSLMTGIGTMCIFAGVWFNGSLLAYQIQHQQLDGVMNWVSTPTEWLPDPVFHPLTEQ